MKIPAEAIRRGFLFSKKWDYKLPPSLALLLFVRVSSKLKPSIQSKFLTMLRFIFCGILGFWLMLLSSISLYLFIAGERSNILHPLIALPLVVLSSLMLLYGIGQWGKWAYLWIFHAPLPSAFVFDLLNTGTGKGDALLPIVLSPVIAYFIVKAYYAPPVAPPETNGGNSPN
ncbi:MAG TPA: hypothetical protein VGH19_13190 [Verrucomicrobiae bacterium]